MSKLARGFAFEKFNREKVTITDLRIKVGDREMVICEPKETCKGKEKTVCRRYPALCKGDVAVLSPGTVATDLFPLFGRFKSVEIKGNWEVPPPQMEGTYSIFSIIFPLIGKMSYHELFGSVTPVTEKQSGSFDVKSKIKWGEVKKEV